jgi:hypothetical protein
VEWDEVGSFIGKIRSARPEVTNQPDVDAYLTRQNEMSVEGRRDSEPLPDNLREKLIRAPL